jgi:hypothetical protein
VQATESIVVKQIQMKKELFKSKKEVSLRG